MEVPEEDAKKLALRQAIQATMRDASLSAQQKQARIQQLQRGAVQGEQTVSVAAPPASKGTAAVMKDSSTMQPQPSKIGASASTGPDPAASKGARASATVTANVAAVVSNESLGLSSPPTVGASSSTGVDPASRKTAPSRGVATLDGISETLVTEPALVAVPNTGAVSSRDSDPAARKASSNRGPAGMAAPPVNPTGNQGVGASSGSRDDDPAARKAARTTRGSNRDAEAPPASATTTSASPAIGAPLSSSLPSRESSVAGLEPVVQDPPSTSVENRSAPLMEEPETYAGVGLVGPDIAGAEMGGIQAYVAGDDAEVVGAAAVVSEAEIEEDDKRRQRRAVKMGVAIFCVLLLAVVVPVSILVPGSGEDQIRNVTDSPTSAPSTPPTSSTFAELLDTLQPLYPSNELFEEAFSDNETPQSKAAKWAADIANLGMDGSDPRMISRYALAAFYYSTNGDNWSRCGQDSTNCADEEEWLTGENECEWFSVLCQEDPTIGDYSVTEIQFRRVDASGNNVNGTLPLEMILLSSLQRISIPYESLKGSIPEEWSAMTSLRDLMLGHNELTGTFPSFLFRQSSLLETLYISDNKMEGELLPFSSASLKALRFEENMFTGQIPSEFGSLEALTELYANDNDLTGEVPAALFNLPALKELDLSYTGLSGSLPETISTMTSLEQLRIVNTNVGGTLPLGLFDLINLQSLDLSDSEFSGTLPGDFVKLSNVTAVRLGNNSFTGSIPDAFSQLEYLGSLELHGNALTGSVSAAVCNQTGDGFFDINVLTTDCIEEVSCTCCSKCY